MAESKQPNKTMVKWRRYSWWYCSNTSIKTIIQTTQSSTKGLEVYDIKSWSNVSDIFGVSLCAWYNNSHLSFNQDDRLDNYLTNFVYNHKLLIWMQISLWSTILSNIFYNSTEDCFYSRLNEVDHRGLIEVHRWKVNWSFLTRTWNSLKRIIKYDTRFVNNEHKSTKIINVAF